MTPKCEESKSLPHLKEELNYFQSIREELLKKDLGKFVLIKKNELIGTYTTEQEAFQAGVDRFGTEAFLIRRIVEKDTEETLPALTLGLINAY